jgi:hypothetical protein
VATGHDTGGLKSGSSERIKCFPDRKKKQELPPMTKEISEVRKKKEEEHDKFCNEMNVELRNWWHWEPACAAVKHGDRAARMGAASAQEIA